MTIGPLMPSGIPGQLVNFDISFTGPTDTNGLSFNLVYGATEKATFTPVFKGTSTTNIDCSTASDLDPGITTSAVVLSSGKIGFTVIGLSLTTGPIPFGRTGVVGTCKFRIAYGARGTIPLTVENTAATCTASNANGDVTATCPSGTLTVGGGPIPTATVPVSAQVTIGPLTPSGAAGQEVDFPISFTGPTDTNGLSFNLIYGATEAAAFTPVFKGTSTTNIDCSTASDLDPGITTSAVKLASGKIGFTVIGLSLSTGPIPFGRTGVIGTCKFTIAPGASGTIPLTVENTFSTCTASDANGDLTAACPNGTLTISGGSGQVTIGPLVPSGAAGEVVNFDIPFNGPTDTNGISFNLIYGPQQAVALTPVFKGTSTTNIDCQSALDLNPGITTTAIVLPSGKIAFTVIGLSLSTGPIPFGRTGVVGTCRFMITPGASGQIPLTVEHTASTCTASNANGDLSAACKDGTLTVLGPTSTPSSRATKTPTGTPTPTPKPAILTVGDGVLFPSQSGMIPVSLTNETTVRALNFTVTDSPDEFSGTTPQCAVDPSRAPALTCGTDTFGDEIRVVMAAAGTGIAPGDGQIAILSVADAPPECQAGTAIRLELSNTEIADQNNTPLPYTTVPGVLHCACRGDANADGTIRAADLSTCIDFGVGERSAQLWERALVHLTCGDQPVSLFDCLAIADVILGHLPPCPRQCVEVVPGDGIATLTLSNIEAEAGKDVTVQVGLENTTEVRALNFDLPAAPGTVNFLGARVLERAARFRQTFHQESDGRITGWLISEGTQAIPAGSGPVMAFDMNIAPMASGNILLHPLSSTLQVAHGSGEALFAKAEDGSIAVQPADTPTPAPQSSGGGGGGGGGGGCTLTPGRCESGAAWLLVVALALCGVRRWFSRN